MKRQLALSALIFAAFLAACSILPKTPSQQLAYVDASFTALVETASDLRDQGALSESQIKRLDEHINRGNTVLGDAWAALRMGQDEQAQQYISVVNSLLILIRNELEGRQ